MNQWAVINVDVLITAGLAGFISFWAIMRLLLLVFVEEKKRGFRAGSK